MALGGIRVAKNDLLFVARVVLLNGIVERSRQIVDYRIEHRLNARS
jgi:hypothetical protein